MAVSVENRTSELEDVEALVERYRARILRFIFASVRVTNLLVRSAVFHRRRCDRRELQRHRFVVRREIAGELVGEMPGAKVPTIPADERHTQPAPERRVPTSSATERPEQGMRD